MSVSTEWADACQRCLEGLLGAAAVLDQGSPERIGFSEFKRTWAAFYLGPFSAFDAGLMAGAAARSPGFDRLIPLSISTHNLHRLVEVLGAEVGDGPLSASRIPERIVDLRESLRRLVALWMDRLGPDSTTPNSSPSGGAQAIR